MDVTGTTQTSKKTRNEQIKLNFNTFQVSLRHLSYNDDDDDDDDDAFIKVSKL